MKEITLLIITVLIFTVTIQAAPPAKIYEAADIIYEVSAERARFSNTEPVSKMGSMEISYWLYFYANCRHVFENSRFDPWEVYHPDQLWKDAIAIVWEESWFHNIKSQDKGTGFGWGAIQWTTAKDNAKRVYDWDWDKDRKEIINSNRLQAKYMVGHLLYLRHYYGNRHKTILGYNKGMNAKNVWEEPYFLKFVPRRRKIDEVLTTQ